MPTARGTQENELPPTVIAFMVYGPPPPQRQAGWLDASRLWRAVLDDRLDLIEQVWHEHRAQIQAAAAPETPWCERLLLAEQADVDDGEQADVDDGEHPR